MHFGATLRLLRLESGLGLRDLARRLGVSSAYLSRVENGLDAAPTPARLVAMARELGVPATLLLDLAHRVSPLVIDYVQQVPEAGTLFLEIAYRRLDRNQIAELYQVLDERFTHDKLTDRTSNPTLSDLLTPERVILDFTCASMEDVLDVAAGRLASGLPARTRSAIAPALRACSSDASSAIGGGVAVFRIAIAGVAPAASLVTLAKPLRYDTPDKQPLRLVIVLVGPATDDDRLLRLALLARLASRGLADQLTPMQSPAQVLTRLTLLEAWR